VQRILAAKDQRAEVDVFLTTAIATAIAAMS